jgi:hypothetical protein
MYYVWDAEMRYWRGRSVGLDLDWKKGFPPFTNTCESLRDRLPPRLSYRLVPMRAPLLDLMWSASEFDVYSPAARQLLREFNVTFEEVPAEIHGVAGRVVSLEYAFVHITLCLKAVDWDRSDVDMGTSLKGEPYVRHTRHLVLRQEVAREKAPVFRLEEANTIILVSEEFRSNWEKRGLTGAQFRSLDHYPKP